MSIISTESTALQASYQQVHLALRLFDLLTIAWHSWKGDVQSDCQLLSSTPVHNQCSLLMYCAIVYELSKSQKGDQSKRDEGNESADVCTNPHIVHCLDQGRQ
jgi:hypothetical protein